MFDQPLNQHELGVLTAGRLQECPVCHSQSCSRFDYIRGTDGVLAALVSCHDCGAIINTTAYADLATRSAKDAQRTDFYVIDPGELAATSEDCADVFANLDKMVPLPRDAVFCDFGAGHGRAALYATRLFRKSIACDWDTRAIEALVSKEGAPANLQIVDDIDRISEKIDVLYLWHALEHLPDPERFWATRMDRLSPGALILLQVPLCRPANVMSAHYVFYTERTLRRWASMMNATPVHIGYDDVRGFLGMVARASP